MSDDRGKIVQLTRAEVCARACEGSYRPLINKDGEEVYINYRNGSYERDKTKYPNGPTGRYGGKDPEGDGVDWRFGDRTPVRDCVAHGMHAAGHDRKTADDVDINQRTLLADAKKSSPRFVKPVPWAEAKPGDLAANDDHMGVVLRFTTTGDIIMSDCSPKNGVTHGVGFRTITRANYKILRPLWQTGEEWK